MIHNLSDVNPRARIGDQVKVGPFTSIAADVEVGEGTIIGPNVTIMDGARIGKHCSIYPGAVISAVPQDLKFDGEHTTIEIGDRTTIRECATINRGTNAYGKTTIGEDCLIMAYVHIAHDCIIGNKVILVNSVALAGHVEVGDWSIISGLSAVHQFVKIGKNSMVGGMSGVEKNILPYCLYVGIRTGLKGLNLVGLKRNKITNKNIKLISSFLYDIFDKKNSIEINLQNLNKKYEKILEIEEMIQFIKQSNKRGIATFINE